MSKKTNWIDAKTGREYYRIFRKVGKKLNKNGIWIDNYMSFYGDCKSEAEQKYKDYMKSLASGIEPSTRCLGEIIEEWIETVFKSCELKETTKHKYLSAYKNVILPSKLIGGPLKNISPLDIQELYNNSESPYSMIKSAHNLLVRFFKYAELHGISRNLTNSIRVPQPEKPAEANYHVAVWENDDVKRILDAYEGTTKRFLIVLAVNTGARLSELLALTYDDIKGNLLYINKQLTELKIDGVTTDLKITTTKTSNSNRVIPLSAPVLQELKKHQKVQSKEMKKNGYTTNYIFTTDTGNFYYKATIRMSLLRKCKKYGIPYNTFHSFRHTFGTNLSRAGVPIEETSKLMGHSDVNVTSAIYPPPDLLNFRITSLIV